MPPCFCKNDSLLQALAQETQVMDGEKREKEECSVLMQKEKSSASEEATDL